MKDNENVLAEKLIKIIDDSRQNALKRVNEELIRMYWEIGQYLSIESEKAVFGDAYIDTIAKKKTSSISRDQGFQQKRSI
ncbi:MAG: DUF1016 N-terminal domain-containing protein [Lachnospiraceae bacterium]|nr:DUF1016 N-terminal domain-containing protein [Lachnospiraceae bacterium]